MGVRLTVEDIASAFESTGLRPVRRTFGGRDEGCGLQAYALAHEAYRGLPSLVSKQLVGPGYFHGFTTGWDYGADAALPREELLQRYLGVDDMSPYLDGVADGAAAAEAIFESATNRELVLA